MQIQMYLQTLTHIYIHTRLQTLQFTTTLLLAFEYIKYAHNKLFLL